MEQRENKSEFWKKLGRSLKTMYMAFTSVAVLVCLSSATYAWFSSNSTVKTDRVSGRSGTDHVTLEVSQTGGDQFRGVAETGIVQVNQYDSGYLMPVSTADLRNFVFNPSTVDQEAVNFLKVENERYYYHGRIFLRATSEGHSENARVALYLDGTELNGSVARNVKGYLANATRVGFLFDNASPKILRLSESENPSENRLFNTVIDGTTLTGNMVIDSSGDKLKGVGDPSESLAKYMIGQDGLTGNGGITPLLTMELNRIYTVDIFFYLEGCDPDCSDVTRMDQLDLHLAFYGVLTEGEVR